MIRLLLRKLVVLAAVLLVVSFVSFSLTSLLPGDPTTQLFSGMAVSPEEVAAARTELGLDKPLPVRYGIWLGRVVRGNLGQSQETGEPVVDLLRRRLSVTVELVLAVQVLALLLAVPIGMWAAHKVDGRFDRLVTAGSFAALAIPPFVTAIALLLVFAVKLHWLPTFGFVRLSDSPIGNLKSLVLPTCTLAVPLIAVYARALRTDLAVTLAQDHVLLARAMGESPRTVLWRRALRQSSFTMLTLVGLQFASLIGGSLIVERIFAIPGMGSLMIEAIGRREHFIVQGGVLVIGAAFVLVNFAIDVLRSVLDPRIRREAFR